MCPDKEIIDILKVILNQKSMKNYAEEQKISKKTAIKRVKVVKNVLTEIKLQKSAGRKPKGYIKDVALANKKILDLEEVVKNLRKKIIKKELIIKSYKLGIGIMKKIIEKLNIINKTLIDGAYLRFNDTEKYEIVKIIEEFKEAKVSLKILSEIINKPVSLLYSWYKNYKKIGINGLKDKPSIPKSQPNKLPKFIISLVESIHKLKPELSADGIYLYLGNNIMFNFIKISKISIYKIITGRYGKNLELREKKTGDNKRGKNLYNIITEGLVVCIDFIEIAKYKVLFVIDDMSRFILGFKIFPEAPTTKGVANFLEKILKKYKIIKILKSDNGTEFKEKFKNFLSKKLVYLLQSPKYYPKFNGKVEYLYKRIRRYLKFVKGKIGKFNIYKILKKFEFNYNYIYGQYVLKGATPYKVFKRGLRIMAGSERKQFKAEQINEKEMKIRFINRDGRETAMILKLSCDGL